ncbi:MAG: prephenate dehydrogenase [Actinomycetaceae bacterium]|nr:prephenate dehydrogenase [Actinomycetaceae bacterium]
MSSTAGGAIVQVAGTRGPVLIIGVGLLGGSLGLSLTALGIEVQLSDTSPTSLALARDMGVGVPRTQDMALPRLVIIATPPDVAGACAVEALRDYPQAYVVDVASVKTPVIQEVIDQAGEDANRYCSCHPMAGREKSGVAAARSDLFEGKPWVVVAHPSTSGDAVLAARTLGVDVGAVLSALDMDAHDKAVALVSHVPQLLSSILGAQLNDAPSVSLALAGQGLRDMTRLADSDARLWTAIVCGNAGPIAAVLKDISADIAALIQACELAEGAGVLAQGTVGPVSAVLQQGNEGVSRVPGKHGGLASRFAEVGVLVPDEPGWLGRLFSEVGDAGVNIEDLHLEHSYGQRAGIATLSIAPADVDPMTEHLLAAGWRIVE